MAQDPVIEALREQRQQVRTAEVLAELPGRAVLFGRRGAHARRAAPAGGLDAHAAVAPPLPPPLATRPRAAEAPEEAGPVELTEIRWHRVPPDERGRSCCASPRRSGPAPAGSPARGGRHHGHARGPRRLHTAFGPPTRTPVARGRPELQGGSAYVQFEYWFAVNDSDPLRGDGPRRAVRPGPDHRRATSACSRCSRDHRGLRRRLMLHDRLMPYVDYYTARERGAWFRTGYDGDALLHHRDGAPAWARRSQDRGRWYDFR
jgi:hypothetical protein